MVESDLRQPPERRQPRRFEEWDDLVHYACEMFGHSAFTLETLARLTGWLKVIRGITYPLEVSRKQAVALLREAYRQRATVDPGSGGRPNGEDAVALEDQQEKEPAGSAAGMTWQEAADRMNRLREQGALWTSQQKLAKTFGCSSGTINKAIRLTPALHTWAKRQTEVAPRAQSLNEVVLDRTPQSRELSPDDEFAIREYRERKGLTPEERLFFDGLSTEDQLDFLNDPDQHPQILGRKA
jgi:hypothetical protein